MIGDSVASCRLSAFGGQKLPCPGRVILGEWWVGVAEVQEVFVA